MDNNNDSSNWMARVTALITHTIAAGLGAGFIILSLVVYSRDNSFIYHSDRVNSDVLCFIER